MQTYSGTHYTTPGFTFPTLLEFIDTTRERLQEPMAVPYYAAAEESAMRFLEHWENAQSAHCIEKELKNSR